MTEFVQHAGELIHFEEDDLGKICVYEHAGKRYLTFGTGSSRAASTSHAPGNLNMNTHRA